MDKQIKELKEIENLLTTQQQGIAFVEYTRQCQNEYRIADIDDFISFYNNYCYENNLFNENLL